MQCCLLVFRYSDWGYWGILCWLNLPITLFVKMMWISDVCRCGVQGPVSISDKTSFHKIQESLEDDILVVWIVASFWNFTGASAAVPVKCQSDRTILNTNLAASRLYEMLRRLIRYWNGPQSSLFPANGDTDAHNTKSCSEFLHLFNQVGNVFLTHHNL